MSLNEEDLGRIGDVVELKVGKLIQPLRDDLKEVQQTVFGAEREKNGGIVSVVKRHEEQIISLRKFRTQVKAIAGVGVPAVQFALMMAWDWVKRKI
jgi:hypothetical protein